MVFRISKIIILKDSKIRKKGIIEFSQKIKKIQYPIKFVSFLLFKVTRFILESINDPSSFIYEDSTVDL